MAGSETDIPDLILLAREAHQESRFSYIPFSEEKVRRIALRAFQDKKRHAVMIARKSSEPVGFVYCSVGEYHIGTDVLLTTIHNLNVLKNARANLSSGKIAFGLLRGVETWSEALGSKETLLHISSGVDLARAHRFAKHAGFQFLGGSYAKK